MKNLEKQNEYTFQDKRQSEYKVWNGAKMEVLFFLEFLIFFFSWTRSIFTDKWPSVLLFFFLMWDIATVFQLCSRIKKSFPNNFFFYVVIIIIHFRLSVVRRHSKRNFSPSLRKKKKRKKTRKNPGSNKVSSRRSNIVFKHFSFVRTEKIKNKKHNVYKRVHFLVCDSPQIICNSNHDGKVFIATLSAIVYAYCDTGRYILRYLVGKLLAYQRNKSRSVDVFKRFVSICK